MIVLDGAHLTASEVAAVARGGETVALAPEARSRNAAARAAIAEHLAHGGRLYGASTGVGALRDREIDDQHREEFQWNLLRSHAVTVGNPLSREIVRAGMVVRANQLGAGGAGVAPELFDALIAALNEGLVPVTRELGSLGTGDLPALCEIALALLGEGQVWREGKPADAPARSRPIRLGMRDGVGFISSNAVTTGHAALLSVDLELLHEAWLTVAALSFEALDADPLVLDERVQAARGSPGQAAVAAKMRELLAGAQLDPRAPNRLVQDPYPFRVLPQVDGVAHDALRALAEVVSRELNARPENALIDDRAVLPTGNFYAGELAAVLDAVRGAMAQSASLIAARVSALLDPRMSGLPPFLSADPGPESGVMMLEYTAHAAASEMRTLALSMATQTAWASLGVESHASFAATAARRTAELLRTLRALVATELVIAVRALRMVGRSPAAGATRKLFADASAVLPEGLEDRAFGRDVMAASAILEQWSPLGVAFDGH